MRVSCALLYSVFRSILVGTLPEAALVALTVFVRIQATDLFGFLIHTSHLRDYSYVCSGSAAVLNCLNSGEIQSATEQYIAQYIDTVNYGLVLSGIGIYSIHYIDISSVLIATPETVR